MPQHGGGVPSANGSDPIMNDSTMQKIYTELTLWCFHTRARQRQDNDKTNVEPVYCYYAFHTRHVGPGVKGIIGMHMQVQHFSCRCLVVVLLWCENTMTQHSPEIYRTGQHITGGSVPATYTFKYTSVHKGGTVYTGSRKPEYNVSFAHFRKIKIGRWVRLTDGLLYCPFANGSDPEIICRWVAHL